MRSEESSDSTQQIASSLGDFHIASGHRNRVEVRELLVQYVKVGERFKLIRFVMFSIAVCIDEALAQ